MQISVRPYLTSGVAVVGATVVAMSPISPVVPSDAAAAPVAVARPVQLAASVNPVTAYLELIENTVNNVAGLGQSILANPAPILQQVITNQLTNAGALLAGLETLGADLVENLRTIAAPALQDAVAAIAAGNFVAAAPNVVTALFQPLLFAALPLLPVLQQVIEQPAANLLAVTQQFQTVAAFAAIGVLGPLSSSIYASAEAIQNVFDAASNGDVLGALGAIVAAPAIVIDGFLNGWGVDGGLISPGLGTISTLLQIRDMIANAIKPAAATADLAEVATVPASAAATLARSTTPDEPAMMTASVQAGLDTSGGIASSDAAEPAGGDAETGTNPTENGGAAVDLADEDTAEQGASEEDAAEQESTDPDDDADLGELDGDTAQEDDSEASDDPAGTEPEDTPSGSDDSDTGSADAGSGGSSGNAGSGGSSGNDGSGGGSGDAGSGGGSGDSGSGGSSGQGGSGNTK
ncbi:hypothetical protein [Mycolicibacterium elephantis]|uniref:hypothetical protein n=1 Tax=Mycolicibacterium elephantis TaxID=81858 RepID=UPI0010422988|nr:hypothetical protein [Mycolicibacterium elephantis]